MRKVTISGLRRLVLTLASLVPVACDTGGDGTPGAHRADQHGESGAAVDTSIEIVAFDDLDAALASRRGQGQLVNIWAMWCLPCVAEMPELVEVAHAYRDRGGRVVGISYDLMVAGSDETTIEEALREFLDARELDIPVLVYDDLDYDAINERFALPGEIPVTLAIDKTGEIVDRQHGHAGKERFEQMMRRALGL